MTDGIPRDEQNRVAADCPNERLVMRKCASCGKEKPLSEMKTCMDSRPMHRHVCDTNCMIKFYA